MQLFKVVQTAIKKIVIVNLVSSPYMKGLEIQLQKLQIISETTSIESYLEIQILEGTQPKPSSSQSVKQQSTSVN